MATIPQSNVAVDVSADSNSWESLSFAGLLSIQDLQAKSSPPKRAKKIKGHSQEFELGPNSTAKNSNENGLTDMSTSDRQLQLQAFLHQPKQLPPPDNHKPACKAAARSKNQRSGDNKIDVMKVSEKPNQNESSRANKNHAASSSSFVQKILLSFVSPCRECHAHKPAIKENIVPRESVKTN